MYWIDLDEMIDKLPLIYYRESLREIFKEFQSQIDNLETQIDQLSRDKVSKPDPYDWRGNDE